jgi:hypothetical protein
MSLKEFFKPSTFKIVYGLVIFMLAALFLFVLPVYTQTGCHSPNCSDIVRMMPSIGLLIGSDTHLAIPTFWAILIVVLEIIVSYILACLISLIKPKRIQSKEK